MKKISFTKGKLFSVLFVPLFSVFYSPLMLIFGENEMNKEASLAEFNSAMNATGTLLWKATAETGSLSEWITRLGGYQRGGNPKMNAAKVLFSNAARDQPKSGSYSYKLKIDAGEGMASTQLFRYSIKGEPNTTKDAIYTVWYYIPQKIDFNKGGAWHNIMQWKVRVSTGKSHPVFTLGLGVQGGRGSRGDNFIELRNTGEFYPGGRNFNYAPLANLKVPIGQWFKLQVRYIHGANNNGRLLVWQGDSRGNDTLIYDVKGVSTYPSKDRWGNSSTFLSWSVNNYASRTVPAVTTIYVDDVSIHLPSGVNARIQESYSINAQPYPKEGGSVKVRSNN